MLSRYLRLLRRKHLLGIAWFGLALYANAAQVSDASKPTPTPIEKASNNQVLAFDVVSIRPSRPGEESSVNWSLPDGYSAKGVPLWSTLILAYTSPDQWLNKWGVNRFLKVPAWVKNERFDIEAKITETDELAWRKQGPEKQMLRTMLQSMLSERCGLVVRHTTAEVSVYALVPGKQGPKMKRAAAREKPQPSNAVPLMNGGLMIPSETGDTRSVTFIDTSLKSFAAYLSGLSNRPVIDNTDLTGSYDFELKEQDESDLTGSDPEPALAWKLDVLGLKLVSKRVSIDALVIDQINRPSEN